MSTLATRFQTFQAHHGPLEGPLADRLLATFFERAVSRFFDYPNSGTTLAAYVLDDIKRLSPDILSVLELAAEWSRDPMKAAERQLRPELEAKAQTEASERKRHEEEELKAMLKTKAEAFMASLKGSIAPNPKV